MARSTPTKVKNPLLILFLLAAAILFVFIYFQSQGFLKAKFAQAAPIFNPKFHQACSPVPNAPDTVSPTISITAPADGTAVPRSSSVAITYEHSDDQSIGRIELYINDELKLLDYTAQTPHTFNWSVGAKPNAKYVIKALACDAWGNNSWSNTVTITSK